MTVRDGANATGGASAKERWRLLPVQLIETEDGVLLKRGATTLHVAGDSAGDVVQGVLAAMMQGMSPDEIRASVSPADLDAVTGLLEELEGRRIVVPEHADESADGSESRLEAFYWNFGETVESVAARVDAGRVTVLGVNEISRRLVAALTAGGPSQFDVVDYHVLRNLDLFEDDALRDGSWTDAEHEPIPYETWSDSRDLEGPRCIVATCDFGATPAIREWNRVCIDNGWSFFPVLIQDLVGYVGPMVVPRETACYECLRARQNSHMKDPVLQRAPEPSAFAAQRLNGFHPALAEIIGDLAALELTKFFSGIPLWRPGRLLEVSLMTPAITSLEVLKVPRCSVCSSMRRQPSTTIDLSIYRLDE